MRLTFLGTSCLYSFPRPGHKDRLCLSPKTDERNRRTTPALSLRHHRKAIVFDAGIDIQRQLKREKISPDAILMTHAHSDHALGLKDWDPKVPVYATASSWKIMEKYAPSIREEIRNGKSFEVEGTLFYPFFVSHSLTSPMTGYFFGKVIYCPELGSLAGIKRWLKEATLVITDGSSYYRDIKTKKIEQHVSMKRQLSYFNRFTNIEEVIFTHIGHDSLLPHAELEVELQKLGDMKARVAYDGMEVRL